MWLLLHQSIYTTQIVIHIFNVYLSLFISFFLFFWFDFDGCWFPIYNHTLFIFSLLSFIHLSFALSLPPVLREEKTPPKEFMFFFCCLVFKLLYFDLSTRLILFPFIKHCSYKTIFNNFTTNVYIYSLYV